LAEPAPAGEMDPSGWVRTPVGVRPVVGATVLVAVAGVRDPNLLSASRTCDDALCRSPTRGNVCGTSELGFTRRIPVVTTNDSPMFLHAPLSSRPWSSPGPPLASVALADPDGRDHQHAAGLRRAKAPRTDAPPSGGSASRGAAPSTSAVPARASARSRRAPPGRASGSAGRRRSPGRGSPVRLCPPCFRAVVVRSRGHAADGRGPLQAADCPAGATSPVCVRWFWWG
jgi:hypothetical protein